MSLAVLIPIAIAAAVAVVFGPSAYRAFDRRQKRRTAEDFYAAQRNERDLAPFITQFALDKFDELDKDGTGVLTVESLTAALETTQFTLNRTSIEYLIRHIGPRDVIGYTASLFDGSPVHTLTPIGHLIGHKEEERVVTGGGMHGPVMPVTYTVNVEVYGITRADLETYEDRVNGQPTLPNPAA